MKMVNFYKKNMLGVDMVTDYYLVHVLTREVILVNTLESRSFNGF
jgi:hypothetical protein